MCLLQRLLYKRKDDILRALRRRPLILDGAMSTMLRSNGHTGNYDILCLTNPDAVDRIHRDYLDAGADIISTNTFRATKTAQQRFGTESKVRDINIAAAQIARKAADSYSRDGIRRYVAGVMGADSHKSMTADYAEQAEALIEGGVDFLLMETMFDPDNCQSAIAGSLKAINDVGVDIPIAVTFALSPEKASSHRDATKILKLFGNFHPMAIGFNCCTASAAVADAIRRFAEFSPYPIIFYPNAGLPDSNGKHPITAEDFVGIVTPLVSDGIVRIAGGCCGTTPEHIRQLSASISVLKSD